MMNAEAAQPVALKKPHVPFTKEEQAPAAVRMSVMRTEQPFEDVQARIAAPAYELYCRRRYREGYAEQDWLDAEREIVSGELLD